MGLVERSIQNYTQHDVKEASAIRRFLSQFVATTVKNMLLFNMSLCIAFPGIIIPALTGIPNEHNLNETLTLTNVQASWLGSIGYFFQPIGSILSAAITDPLGRKRSMICVNIPFVVAWILMYNAHNIWSIYFASSLMGLAIGLMESPVITYIGEICEPTNRGILIAYTNVSGSIGSLLVFGLNTLMPWRTVALVCLCVPILTVIALCFIPDTPLWLLSKNRHSDAEKALSWLRGWVSTKAVAREFQELQRYSQRSKSCNICIKKDQICTHPLPTLLEKCAELKRMQTLKPLVIVLSLFVFAEFTGISGMSPFMVQIFKAYDSPIAPDRAAAILSFTNNLANIAFLCLIRFTGKRPLYLTMLSIVFLSSAIVCGYGFTILPTGYNSFDQENTFLLENKQLAYIPFVCIILWSFCSYSGVNSVPWQMLSEIYPFKVRGVAAGLSAALDYALSFICTKTYYNLEIALSMPGITLLNCIISGFGVILIYKIMPETENRTLEDIEMHFSDKTKKITDRKIAKVFDEVESDQIEHHQNTAAKSEYGKNNKNYVNLAFEQ